MIVVYITEYISAVKQKSRGFQENAQIFFHALGVVSGAALFIHGERSFAFSRG
jgi:hypothetical protein